jgi:hypothetical protein
MSVSDTGLVVIERFRECLDSFCQLNCFWAVNLLSACPAVDGDFHLVAFAASPPASKNAFVVGPHLVCVWMVVENELVASMQQLIPPLSPHSPQGAAVLDCDYEIHVSSSSWKGRVLALAKSQPET